MSNRDIVVIGASAGGVEALRAVVGGLATDLPAAVLVVLHVPRSSPSALPQILGRKTALRVRPAVDGEPLRHRRVYVAPVDRHLLVLDNRVRLSRGPIENGHRPAVDPLFRSAAQSFGPRTIGVILSGVRDDGAAGLAAVAKRGGLTIVQDPSDALHASMPRSAMAYVTPDHVAPAGKIGELISTLTRQPAPEADSLDDPTLAAEVAMSDVAPVTADNDAFDGPAGYGCPACGGSLFKVNNGPIPRYRCRIGHAWSPESLLDEQAAALESSLWMALRTLEERAALSQYLANLGADPMRTRSPRYLSMAGDAERAAKLIRKLIEEVGAPADGDVVESGY